MKPRKQRLLKYVAWCAVLTFVFDASSITAVRAEPQLRAGPYHIEITTDPPVIPVGQPTKIVLKITDGAGKPIERAQVSAIAQMPGMAMGEHDETALPQAGQPGMYAAPAQFAMQGNYTATIRISGPQGAATGTAPLHTGQNTASGGIGSKSGISFIAWMPWLLIGASVVFIVYRMRRTGQRFSLRPLLNWRTWAGIALLVVVFLISSWAVHKYTVPGHMSVIEAQAMDMTVMKPPIGAVPVAAMAAKREPIDATVRYTGSAVSYVDQDVTARVPGTILSMTAYPGQPVHRGQVLATLDPRELASRVGEQQANVQMAAHATEIARRQYQQALGTKAQARAQVSEARSNVGSARSTLAASQQDVSAAQEEKVGAQADLDSAQTGVTDAQAQLSASQADQTYWSAQVKRSQALFTSGSISKQELQQDQAQSENANAKVRQAQARIQQVNATVRAAQARIRKADAMIASAQAKVADMQAKIQSSQSKVVQAQANANALTSAADGAQHEIAHSQAGVRQAEAQLNTARVVAGYTEIRADVNGVITQRYISPGVLVQPGQAILKVSQISPIRLQANVAESDLPNIRVGGRVRVTTARDPGHTVEAHVSSVFPAADPSSRTSVVEAIIANLDRRFVPGEYITMDITTGENRKALVVPSSAVIYQAKATSPVLATEQTAAVWVITAGQPEQRVYTCTMHPEVKQDRPGKCPT